MYMRVVRGRIDPARLDEVNQVAPDLAAAIRRQPGHQSSMGGMNRATGQTIVVSTWDTEEHARFTQSRSDLASRFQAVGVQSDPPEFFEVVTT